VILPGKHLRHDRALLGIGAEILKQLDRPQTVSELWERTRMNRGKLASPLSFDWFVLTITFLYAASIVDFDGVFIAKAGR
jgi:hypothetical protein